jgi:dTDP-4-amino-4,6-dideoxygalactose transaminase
LAVGTKAAIPLFNTWPLLELLLPEIGERQRAVLESGRFILGPEVEAFEEEFAAYLGRRHCVGVANGTEALTISLKALGIGAGDEVIVPDFTFFATAEAVVNAGAEPVFAEIDADTGCITRATAEAAISERTRAIVPVHIFGNPAPMAELLELAKEQGLRVIEDAAQAAGARLDGQMAGAFGDLAAFSFYPSKYLGALGDAGAIVTDDPELASAARRLREHGASERWVHEQVGHNSRLDALQAVALRVQLPHLNEWTQSRARVAAAYRDSGLAELASLQSPTAGSDPAHHLFVIKTPQRELLEKALAKAGIESRAYYTTPMHRQPALEAEGTGAYPNAGALAEENLALPMGPALEPDAARAVTAAIREATTP